MLRVVRTARFCPPLRRLSTKPPDISGGPTPVYDIPLSQPLPGFPKLSYISASDQNQYYDTKITRFPNGLRVASQQKFGQFCTIGIVIDSGSRYEVNFPSGIAHFLEKLAFQSTKQFASRDIIMQKLEQYGGICDCQISRDATVYAASVEIDGYDGVVEMLNEVSRRMVITEDELTQVRRAIRFDLEDLATRHEQEPILTEIIHAAAYRDNTLGLPRVCPASNIDKIDRQTLLTYLSQHYRPESMIVAGVGIDHNLLVESVENHFMKTAPTWIDTSESKVSQTNLPDESKLSIDRSIAQYTGGEIRVPKDLSDISMGITPIPELVHFVLAFESCSHQDPDFIPYCVLNILMGGGGSFSAGGPGKGMYTRLYLNVLNHYHWLYNATAYNHTYVDSGLFCIYASSDPAHGAQMVNVIVREFKRMAGPVEEIELNRAKTQLSSMLMMNLESRPVIFEDIGRQVLAYGRRKPSQSLLEEINKVTAEDVVRVAIRMLRSKPTVACLGKIEVIPTYAQISEELVKLPELKRAKKFSIFS